MNNIKGIEHLKPEHYKGHTVFIMKVTDGRTYPIGGIIVKGIHDDYSVVNNMNIHVKELYNFRTKEKLMKKAEDIINSVIKGNYTKYPVGIAVFGDR